MSTEPGDPSDGPLWADGDMMFRVSGAGAEPDRQVKVSRPFGLIGRTADANIAIDDRAVSARHAYLHLDPRGVYVVDLITRTGTRINGNGRMVGWLRPGDWIEVAGRRIELLRVRLGGTSIEPAPCDVDMLSDHGQDTLVNVTLEPRRSSDSPWVLGSELVFLGWSASCGIQIKDTAVARTHCALVRSARGAYLVDLCGRQTWVEGRLVRGAAVLSDGDLITLGSTHFTARIEPSSFSMPADNLPQVIPRSSTSLSPLVGHIENPASHALATFQNGPLPIHPDLVPAEAQTALLAWMMGTIQGGQGEILRRQGEFQLAITEVLRQIQQDNATLVSAQLQRIENIDREIVALRNELERRNARQQAPPPPPNVAPLKIDRPSHDAAQPEAKATTWLLQRVSQLEDENRSAWKDLLGRLTQPKKNP